MLIAEAEWAEQPGSLANAEVARRCRETGVPIVTARAAPNIAAILAAIGAGVKVALIRPDRHVCAVSFSRVWDDMLECPTPLVLPATEWAARQWR